MSHSFRLPTVLISSFLAFAGVGRAQVVINEVSYDAVGSDDGSVFVELFGPAGFDVSGWLLQSVEGNNGTNNPQNFTFPQGTVIPNDGFLVVADELGSTGTTNVPNADFIASMDLENGPDGLQLIDANGALVDAMAYGAVFGTINTSNGLPYVEGNPTRDFFAPLSLERCPAGSDTNDNAVDFRPNEPTPGTGETCCTAIEWVNMSSGSRPSASAGGRVGLDLFFDDCAANGLYITLASLVDPAVVPPPAPLPVFDPVGTPIFLSLINLPPFVQWSGTLDGNGEAVGTAVLDFAGTAIVVPSAFDIWVGGIALDPNFNILGTNTVVLTIQP